MTACLVCPSTFLLDSRTYTLYAPFGVWKRGAEAVAGATQWAVEWYRTTSWEVPAKTFLDGLAERPLEEALALLELAKRRGNQLREPKSKALGEGLFELRGHQVRLFYVFRPGRQLLMLDGMVKKRDEIPRDVIQRLRQMQQAITVTDPKANRGP